MVTPIASIVVPIVGQVGKASKISKAKTVLKGLEELSEIAADAQLVKDGWKIEWKFIDCELSEPLRTALKNANIKIIE